MKHLNFLSKFCLVFMLSFYSVHAFGMEALADTGEEAVEEGAEGAFGRASDEAEEKVATTIEEDSAKAAQESIATDTEDLVAKEGLGGATEEATEEAAEEGASKIEAETEGIIGKTGEEAVGDAAKEGAEEDVEKLAQKAAKLQMRTDEIIAQKTAGDLAKATAEKGLLRRGAAAAGGIAWDAVKTLANAVLFMIPNIFQSSMLAQKQRQVELQTIAAPLQFGDWVLQVPDSCINMDTPSSSFPVYVRIPVKSVGTSIDATIAKQQFDNSISGPSTSNAVSSAIHSFGEDVFSFGAAQSENVNRYKIGNEGTFYDKAGLVVAFAPAGSYGSPASSMITSSQFAGLVVDLNTGFVMDAAGEQNSVWPLINLTVPGTDPHGNPYGGTPVSVKDFLPVELSKLEVSGSKVTFTQYKNVTSGSKGNAVSGAMLSQFNCACIDETSDTDTTCHAGDCLLKKSLDAYASGLFLNAAGIASVVSASAGGLGSVVPLFGWGAQSLVNETIFPDSTPVDPTQYSLISALPKGASGFWSNASAPQSTPVQAAKVKAVAPVVEYADPDFNYGAQGCWVYLCSNTAFAHALQMQESGGKLVGEQSVFGPLVDYIIFLDETGQNQVPLQAPMLQEIASGSGVKWPVIGQNPAVKYWASLISSGIASFDQDGGAVMYDLQGNAYANPALSGIVQAAIAELSSYKSPQTGNSVVTFPNLATQFTIHSQAMLSKYFHGPFSFGNVKLTESSQEISVPAATAGGAATTINFYEGMNCFASSIPDLLLPMDSSGNTAQLPNPNVANFYSVVTDISYTKLADGSLKPTDFSQAPIIKTGKVYTLKQSAKNTFNILNTLSQSVGASNVTAVAAYAKAQREAWFDNFENSAQAQGFNLGSLAFKLAVGLSTKEAMIHDCFIYEVTPSPSAAVTNQDFYVLVNAGQSTLETLTPISVLSASSKSTVVSLLTGFLYDTKGNQLLDATGTPIQLTSTATTGQSNETMGQAIYAYMIKKFPVGSGMSQAFQAQYLKWVTAYAAQMHRPMGPYTFGSLHVGIYAGDLANENYVYFSAAGMHRQDFEPTDMFITVDLAQSPPAFGQQLNGDTKNLLSLVSGQLYNAHGPVSILPQNKLIALTDQLSAKWGHWLKTNVARLQQASVSRIAAEKASQAELDAAFAKVATSKVLLAPSEVLAIIKRLTSVSTGLPVPYASLAFDPLKQTYVRTSPASPTDNSALLYQFFDVPNSYEQDGKPAQMGAVFDQTGKQIRVVQGVEQKATLDQYGVVVHADGTQSLGVPLLRPSLLMTDADTKLVPGQSGESLIVSSSPDFPGKNLKLARGYYLYFSKIMGTYYAFETKRQQWISIEGGNLYEKDGTPVTVKNKVAKIARRAGQNDMILLYDNAAGYTQGYVNGVDYKNVNSTSGAMSWMCSAAPYNTITVTENKQKTSYAVGEKTYMVNASYDWEPMVLVPIDDSGKLLTTIPNASYSRMQVVSYHDDISHVIFNKIMYKKAVQTGAAGKKDNDAVVPSVVTMVPVVGDATDSIELSMGVDSNTLAPFIVVNDGKNSYKYGYLFDALDHEQQSSYQASVWRGMVVPCPIAFPVGPMKTNSKIVGDHTVTVSVPDHSTYSLFIPNISKVSGLKPVSNIVGAPAATTPEGQLFGLNLFRIMSSSDGRFFATMFPSDDTNPEHAPVVSYFDTNGYVDLKTGALFDGRGMAYGTALNLNDWIAVLNKVQVTVMPNEKGVDQLVYRTAHTVQQQTKQLVENSEAAIIA